MVFSGIINSLVIVWPTTTSCCFFKLFATKELCTGKSLSEAFLFAEHGENMLRTKIILNVRNNFCAQHVLPRFELEIFMYWICNSMNNLSSYSNRWCKNKSFWQRFTYMYDILTNQKENQMQLFRSSILVWSEMFYLCPIKSRKVAIKILRSMRFILWTIPNIGVFHLVARIIRELKSHMIPYKFKCSYWW